MATRTLQPPSNTRRNVHLYNNDGQIIGGVYQNGSITNSNFLEMCAIFLHFPDDIRKWHIYELSGDGSTGSRLQRNSNPLRTGTYIVLGPGATPIPAAFTDTRALRRVLSESGRTSRLSRQRKYFRDAVRTRDLVCSVSGLSLGDESFTNLQAAHIFPLAREVTWNNSGYRQSWVTDTSSPNDIGVNRIHSPQNGLLLMSHLHGSFDTYAWAINPNDDYKITWFVPGNNYQIDGQRLRDNPLTPTNRNHRVSDRILYWHFKQAVLKNMRGAAAEQWPDWEHDFQEGEDIIGTIMEGPDAGERMELELAMRLGAGDDTNVLSDSSGTP